MSAVHQVLDTYELLENILMHLPLRRLLLAQRVNASFRDLIWRSANINRVLFFQPATTETVDWYRPEDAQPPREVPFQGIWRTEVGGKTIQPMLNPFLPVYRTSRLVAMGGHVNWQDRCAGDFDYEHEGRQKLLDGPQHLAFSTPPRRFYCDYWDDESARLCDDGAPKLKPFLDSRWHEAMKASSGSFKDMLVTHPPCRSTRILCDIRLRRPCYYFAVDVDVEEEDWGARFGPFIYAASEVSTEQRWWHDESFARTNDDNTVEVVGGELWRLCPKTVDEISGWEMLRLLMAERG